MKKFLMTTILCSMFLGHYAFARFNTCTARIEAADRKPGPVKFEVTETGKIQMKPQYLKDEVSLHQTSNGYELVFLNNQGTYTKIVTTTALDNNRISHISFLSEVTKAGTNPKSQFDDYFGWTGDDCWLSRMTKTSVIDGKMQTYAEIDKSLCQQVQGIVHNQIGYRPPAGSPEFKSIETAIKDFITQNKIGLGTIGSEPYSDAKSDTDLIQSLSVQCGWNLFKKDQVIPPPPDTPRRKSGTVTVDGH